MNMKSHESFENLHSLATSRGQNAATNCIPLPMTVLDQYRNQEWYEPEGVCGFAWVRIKGNTPFGRWARGQGIARKAYGGGLQIRIRDYNQSMDRKYAHANAYALTLREHGIEAWADSRMD
jgi:hypothetical protein